MLHLISPPRGAKFHRESLSWLPLRLRVPIGALVKTLANDGPEAHLRPIAHSVRPNLSNISRFQSIAVVQPRAKGLYMSIFWSPNGSSAPFVTLKPWNHQFSLRKTNGWHSAVGNSEHGKRRVVPESGPSWHSKSVFDRTTWPPLGLSRYYCSIVSRDLGAQNDPLVVPSVGHIHFVGTFP